MHREVSMFWAIVARFCWVTVFSVTFLHILNAFISVSIRFLRRPEPHRARDEKTQRTLEELDCVFAVLTRKYIAYQGGTFLLFWIKKQMFRRRDAVLPPLTISRR
jgi:hypothetical protein